MRHFLALIVGLVGLGLSWYYETPLGGGIITAAAVMAIWPEKQKAS